MGLNSQAAFFSFIHISHLLKYTSWHAVSTLSVQPAHHRGTANFSLNLRVRLTKYGSQRETMCLNNIFMMDRSDLHLGKYINACLDVAAQSLRKIEVQANAGG